MDKYTDTIDVAHALRRVLPNAGESTLTRMVREEFDYRRAESKRRGLRETAKRYGELLEETAEVMRCWAEPHEPLPLFLHELNLTPDQAEELARVVAGMRAPALYIALQAYAHGRR